jgi:hypothetical protein
MTFGLVPSPMRTITVLACSSTALITVNTALITVKKKDDPANLVRYAQSIPASA